MNTTLRCLLACLLASLAMPASAATFAFSYVTRNDDPFGRPAVTASGTITADVFAGNMYTVTNITGTRAGAAIDGYDDFDTLQTFTLDAMGTVTAADFAYRVLGVSYNVFGTPPIFTENPVDPDTFVQVEPARTLAQLSIVPSVAAVPEPTSWATMIAGLGIVGAAARRRRKAVVPA